MTRICASRLPRAATSCSVSGSPSRLGKTGDEAETYAKSVVLADFEEAGDADVLRKAYKDLEAAGKTADEAELKAKLVQLTERAIEEVKAGR